MPQHVTWDPWSAEDDVKLAKWAGKKPDYAIAKLLGRTRTAVQQRAAKKGLSLCFGRKWERISLADVKKAAELRGKYRFAAEAARAMGIDRQRFALMLKYAKQHGYT